MTPADLVHISIFFSLTLLIVALLLTIIRVVIGPTLADRVLALDMLVAVAIGFIAVIAIRTGQDLYIDIALALGAVGFLATVAFARFIATSAEAVKSGARKVGKHSNPPKPVQRRGKQRSKKR